MRVPSYAGAVARVALLVVVVGCQDAGPVAPTADDVALRTTDGVRLERLPRLDAAYLINDERVIIGEREGHLVRRSRKGALTPVSAPAWAPPPHVFRHFARDMNNRGVVLAGLGGGGGLWLSYPNGDTHVLPGGYHWHAINRHGVVVGHQWGSDPSLPRSVRSATYSPEAGLRELQGPGAAFDINDYGEVVGFDLDRTEPDAPPGWSRPFTPVYWDRNGVQHALDPIDFYQGSVATSISNTGHIVGWANDLTPISAARWHRAESGAPHLYVGEYLSRGGYSEAFRVTDAGLILGFHETGYAGAPLRATVWLPDGNEVELGTLDGIDYYPSIDWSLPTHAEGINNHGEVVGLSPLPEPPHELTAVQWTIPRGWWHERKKGPKSLVMADPARGRERPSLSRHVDEHWPAPVLAAECVPSASAEGVRALAACVRAAR